ncbi:MAG: hypothetical protein JXR91_02740 [Deltaproteobacteria bacterium]|nr:hypothetical protein [Deltaproteobacteria bacterium]
MNKTGIKVQSVDISHKRVNVNCHDLHSVYVSEKGLKSAIYALEGMDYERTGQNKMALNMYNAAVENIPSVIKDASSPESVGKIGFG